MCDLEHIGQLIDDMGHTDFLTCLNARKQLVSLGETVIDELMKTLQIGSDMQRVHAAIALGKLHDMRAFDYLVQLRTHPNTLIRIDGAKALGALGTVAAIDILLSWLKTEHNILVQTAIVEALSGSRDNKIIEALLNLLHQADSPTLIYLVIRVLGDMGDPGIVDSIAAYANDSDHHIRREAKIALKKLMADFPGALES